MTLLGGKIDENPFWNFATKFYSREAVASSCLTLQNEFGADVNILIYCCWIAAEGAEEIGSEELKEIITMIKPWQSNVVKVLRDIRHSMRQNEIADLGVLSVELRKEIKKCELEAEKIEQSIIYESGLNILIDSSLSTFQKIENANLNLKNYLQLLLGNELGEAQYFIDIISNAVTLTIDD
jgi:uncharacterized protein (TIGR02444 family)